MHIQSEPVAMDTRQNGFEEYSPPLLFAFTLFFRQLFKNTAGSKSPQQITSPVPEIQSQLNKERHAPISSNWQAADWKGSNLFLKHFSGTKLVKFSVGERLTMQQND